MTHANEGGGHQVDLIRADPEALDAFAADATRALTPVGALVDGYARAWAAFASAPSSSPNTPPTAKASPCLRLLGDLRTACTEAGAYAAALRALDTDGDDALTANDQVDPKLLALLLAEYRKDPSADPDALEARAQLVLDTGVELITVRDGRDGSDGRARVLQLNLRDLGPLEGLDPDDLRALLETYGLTGEDGDPVHFVVHGWNSSGGNPAEHVADLYDAQGVPATVISVDWEAGDGGFGGGNWGALGGLGGLLAGKVGSVSSDFKEGEARAKETGDALAALLTELAASNPDAEVKFTAHSLGNHVALRALSQMDLPVDPDTGEELPFSVDYVGIQAAIPDDAFRSDPDHYGALADGRIDHLTLSINDGDKALLGYESPKWDRPEALGDESTDSEELRDLIALREELGLTTDVAAHGSDDGMGHLTIDPAKSDLVRSLVDEQIDRGATGTPSPQTAAREYLYDLDEDVPDYYKPDIVFESARVQDYLRECQEDGVAPSTTRLREFVDELYPDRRDQSPPDPREEYWD